MTGRGPTIVASLAAVPTRFYNHIRMAARAMNAPVRSPEHGTHHGPVVLGRPRAGF